MKKDIQKVQKKQQLTLGITPFKQDQLLHILQKTPKDHVYKRPGKGGGQWDYVTGTYVKKVLNYVFGWMWDFEVKEHLERGGSVIVLGRLTAQLGTQKITKEQWGRAEIKMKKGTNDPLDYGNDLKAATTDALKKCASELGIASDIYGAEEFKEINRDLLADLPNPKESTAKEIEVTSGGPDEATTMDLQTKPENTTPIETPQFAHKPITPDFKSMMEKNKQGDVPKESRPNVA